MRSVNKPLWIAVTGPKKSGKTSVIEALIPLLKKQGYRVATMKHTTHQHTFDKAGTDSFRHARAGADHVGIVSPETGAFFIYNIREMESSLDALYEAFFSSYDIVLCEGFRNSSYPKIVLESEGEMGNEVAPPVIVRFKPTNKSAEKPCIPDNVRDRIIDYIRTWKRPDLQ